MGVKGLLQKVRVARKQVWEIVGELLCKVGAAFDIRK